MLRNKGSKRMINMNKMATGTSCLALLTAVLLLYPSGAVEMPRKEGSHSALNDFNLTLTPATHNIHASWGVSFPRVDLKWQDQYDLGGEFTLDDASAATIPNVRPCTTVNVTLYANGVDSPPTATATTRTLGSDIGLTLFSGAETVVAKWDTTFPRVTVTWQGKHGGYEEIHLKKAAEAVIQGVRPCTTVAVSVYPEGVDHFPAAARPVRTKPKAPPMVDNLSIPSQSAQTFTLSWERPNTTCEITAYNITYSGVAKWGTHTEHTGSATIDRGDANSTTSIVIDGLQPYTHYNVTVVAACEAGWGKSATTQVGTGEAGKHAIH